MTDLFLDQVDSREWHRRFETLSFPQKLVFFSLQTLGITIIFCIFLLRMTGVGYVVSLLAKMLEKLKRNGLRACIKKNGPAVLKAMDRGLIRTIIPHLMPLCTSVLRLARISWFLRQYYRYRGYQIVPVYVDRIGHTAAELDSFVRESLLLGRSMNKTLVLAPRDRKGVNLALINLYSKYVQVVESPLWCNLLSDWALPVEICFLPNRLGSFPTHHARDYVSTDSGATYPRILAQTADRPPVISFSDSDRAKGEHLTRLLGIPSNAWYVCVHCRERGFHDWEDESNCRDAHVENYFLAMSTIVSRGGWCIRMGDSAMTKLPAMPGVIDYAHAAQRSDWLDIYLAGTCRFFLGSASGLACVANAFNIPCATANQVPLSVVYSHGVRDISIPKLYWSESEMRVLTFEEILTSPLGDYRKVSQWRADNLSPLENASEDINQLVIEMLDVLEGCVAYSADDQRLQEQARLFFGPKHYSYFSKGRIGKAFLQTYRDCIFKKKANDLGHHHDGALLRSA